MAIVPNRPPLSLEPGIIDILEFLLVFNIMFVIIISEAESSV